MAQTSTSIYTVPCRELDLVPACAGVWHVSCPGDASLARVARLSWSQLHRRWELIHHGAPADPAMPGAARMWADPGSDQPHQVPRWVESAVFAQVGAWALLGVRQLVDQKTVMQACLAELAVRLEAHRADVWESNEQGGQIDDPETAAYIAELDLAIAISRALLGSGREDGEEGVP